MSYKSFARILPNKSMVVLLTLEAASLAGGLCAANKSKKISRSMAAEKCLAGTQFCFLRDISYSRAFLIEFIGFYLRFLRGNNNLPI